jgi:hypothetical protein
MDDIEIETIDMEKQESVEEIDTKLVQQSIESIQVNESTIPTQQHEAHPFEASYQQE